MLKKLTIDNYRSFSDTTIEFGQFNCLIGPNNAGKSNLIDALEFLDIAIYHSIDRAVKDKSGKGQIKNYRSQKEEIILNAEFEFESSGFFGYDIIGATYKVIVQIVANPATRVYIKDITISGKFKHLKIKEKDFQFGGYESILWDSMECFNSLKELDPFFVMEDSERYEKEFKQKRMKSFSISMNQLGDKSRVEFDQELSKDYVSVLSKFFSYKPEQNILPADRLFTSSIGLFDSYFFIPYLIRHQRTNESELNANGTSLINVLSLLKEMNPLTLERISYSLIGEIEVANGIDSNIVNNLPELDILETMPNDGESHHLNLMQASEGTVHFLAIMTAILASKHDMIMIEEPERSLHMKTLSYIVDQCRNSNKQIFITTHSSELLRLLDPKEITFIYRDRNGNSKAKMASSIPYLSRMMKRTKYDIVELIQTGIIGDFEDDE